MTFESRLTIKLLGAVRRQVAAFELDLSNFQPKAATSRFSQNPGRGNLFCWRSAGSRGGMSNEKLQLPAVAC